MSPNPYLLIADGRASEVLLFLDQNPQMAAIQDEHGYSLVHAAASYNEPSLLRTLINQHKVNVNIRDEDNETPLFSAETIPIAKMLVEELDADVLATGNEGRTAAEAIEEDGDFPDVALYLRSVEDQLKMVNLTSNSPPSPAFEISNHPLLASKDLHVTVGTAEESDPAGIQVDSEFRARIEELASRDDLDTPEAQAQLRQLVQDAVSHQNVGEDRHTRPKTRE